MTTRLMKPEFAMQMKRLGMVFGNYSPPEAERIYLAVRHLNKKQFERMVNAFIDAGVKPRIPHFKAKARSFIGDFIPGEQIDPEKFKGNDCQWCFGTGWNEVWGDGFDMNVMIQCDEKCKHWEHAYAIKDSTIPHWVDGLFVNVERRPLTLVKWKPEKSMIVDEKFISKENEMVKSWNQEKDFARRFWPRFIDRQIKGIARNVAEHVEKQSDQMININK